MKNPCEKDSSSNPTNMRKMSNNWKTSENTYKPNTSVALYVLFDIFFASSTS